MVPIGLLVGILLLLAAGLTFTGIKEFNVGLVVAIIFEAFVAILVLLAVKNCSVRIVTDVNDHHLDSVHRYRMAEKLLAFIVEHMKPYLAEESSSTSTEVAAREEAASR